MESFEDGFRRLIGYPPMTWQRRLHDEHFARGVDQLPSSLDIPTGLGKTSVMAIWYLARRAGARLPRRLVYVVDRRAIVDQATAIAEDMASQSEGLVVSTLRGRYVDNRLWLADPGAAAIVVGTVDMIGSRTLFNGYGVSRRMLSYHAGFLGADSLVVLDEAHLVPPFEALMRSISQDSSRFGPLGDERQALVPPCRVLSLSATGRLRDEAAFGLGDGDRADPIVARRLNATKRLQVEPTVEPVALADALAGRAWERGSDGRRVVVFCNSRKTAIAVRRSLERLVHSTSATRDGLAGTGSIELLVGARRVYERTRLAESDTFRRFSEATPGNGNPVFLICTSAGEVGVDLDADHAVCDLVPWERMVQRLGRVNRRGDFGGSLVDVFPSPADRNEVEPAADVEMLARWRAPFEADQWPSGEDGRRDASPRSLGTLREDPEFRALADAATTPAPLHPELTRPLIDAWCMTSLEDHTGRPKGVTPWLRGWLPDELPQTTIVWRRFLPVRQEGDVSEEEIEAFFEAAPPHLSEMLETETWVAAAWLVTRAAGLQAAGEASSPRVHDDVAFILSGTGEVRTRLTLASLVACMKGKNLRDRLQRQLAEAVLVVDSRLCGLAAGLLDEDCEDEVETADGGVWLQGPDGIPAAGFRLLPNGATPVRGGYRFVVRTDPDGEPLDWLQLETWSNEESRATASRPQALVEHQDWTERCALSIADSVGLSSPYREALGFAGRLHDEGKKAARWQAAFNADTQGGPYAKTRGPINFRRLDGYRHEFGSLPFVEADPAFQAMSDDLKDLVLHMVAAHHGRARPLIETGGCEDAPPSVLLARARAVAERFARLQRAWGPWGLAWWEALLRAADQQASRRNDECGLCGVPPSHVGEVC